MITSEKAKQLAIASIKTSASVAYGSICHCEPHWIVKFIYTYKSGRVEYVTIKVHDETGEVQK